MPNEKFKNGGPGSIGDLARQGGDVAANILNEDLLMNYGAGFWSDLARNGGDVIPDDEGGGEEPEPEFDASMLNDSNTGCRIAEGLLTPAVLINTSSIGQTFEGLIISDRIVLNHDNCIIRDCVFTGDGDFNVQTSGDDTPVTIEYCTFRNAHTCISASGIFKRNNISLCENGIVVWHHGEHTPGGKNIIEENYIHIETGWPNADVDPHNDGIESFGMMDTIIRNNKIIGTSGQDNSMIYIDNSFGTNENLEIYGNYIRGANYALQFDGDNGAFVIDLDPANFHDNSLGEGLFGYVYTNEVGFVEGDLEATNTFVPA